MKIIKIFLVLAVFLIMSVSLNAQFKGPDENMRNKNILGIFNPKNFTMQHSFQISYLSSSYGNVSLTSYVNSMNYKISDKLNISADVRIQYSPFANSGFGNDFSGKLQNDLTGIFLSKLSLDYKISENSFFSIQFRRFDESMYNNYDNPFYRNSESRLSNWR